MSFCISDTDLLFACRSGRCAVGFGLGLFNESCEFTSAFLEQVSGSESDRTMPNTCQLEQTAEQADRRGDANKRSNHAKDRKRGIFSKPATNIMRKWLFDHLHVSSKLDSNSFRRSFQTRIFLICVIPWLMMCLTLGRFIQCYELCADVQSV